MANRLFSRPLSRVARQFGIALVMVCGWTGVGTAQAPAGAGEGAVQGVTAAPPVLNYVGGATNTLCGSCGGGGCGEEGCYPGRGSCTTCEGQGRLGRLFCAFHNALCCPDPCYQPRWNDTANAAFFTDSARTTTMTRIRWDAGRNLVDPDRGGYFFGANAFAGAPAPTRVDYNELHLYQEFGGDKFSAFIDLPYRSLDTNNRGGAGGIGDLAFGTKTMFLDSELLQMTFQFRTTVPTGGTGNGVGIGSVSLDPSLLTTIKLYHETYWQSQVGYWFAVGSGDGSVVHYHNSFNRVIARPLPDAALIGTFEMVGYTFAGGGVRNPVDGTRVGTNGVTYFSVGPGLRFAICDKLDLGIGMQFAVTSPSFAQQLYRTELRWRF